MSQPGLPVPPAGTTGLGIDIIRVDRIVRALAKHGRRFPLRILTPAEDAYVRDRPENLAGRWAAKEAVLKALGTGWSRGISWRDIEVRNELGGRPHIVLDGGALDVSRRLGIQKVLISISHCRNYATAYALAVGP